jgi:hypothetical protein
MLAGDKVLMALDDNNALIVGNLEGILGQRLRPCLINSLNIITLITIILLNYILKNYIIK